jgi:hypothetical protein
MYPLLALCDQSHIAIPCEVDTMVEVGRRVFFHELKHLSVKSSGF